MPLAHVSLPTTSLAASRAFYERALAPLGYAVFLEVGDLSVGFAPPRAGPDFWLHRCPDLDTDGTEGGDKKVVRKKKKEKEEEEKGGKTEVVQKTHVAFQVASREVVRRFHEGALKAGATCNGPPGERDYTKGYYAAYVLDPDGNNIEAMHWRPWWLIAVQGAPTVLGAVAVGVGSWWLGSGGGAGLRDAWDTLYITVAARLLG